MKWSLMLSLALLGLVVAACATDDEGGSGGQGGEDIGGADAGDTSEDSQSTLDGGDTSPVTTEDASGDAAQLDLFEDIPADAPSSGVPGTLEDVQALLVGDWLLTSFRDSGETFEPVPPEQAWLLGFTEDGQMRSAFGDGASPPVCTAPQPGYTLEQDGESFVIVPDGMEIRWTIVELTDDTFSLEEGTDVWRFDRGSCDE